MRLSLVIPVWNDRDGLTRLLSQAVEMGVFAEIIIADDASDQDLSPKCLGFPAVHMRSDERRGAGAMRNLGLDQVTGSHVIFFDSDDLFAPGFAGIAHSIAQEHFDFCIFRHNDSRLHQGTFPSEERLWTLAGAAPIPAPPYGTALCRLSAYPWNKIYRTDFLRSENIRCTEIPVHNDLELHWASFIVARRILCTTQVGAMHFVGEGGSRLTNRRGAERLRVFEALDAILIRLQSTPDAAAYTAPLIGFAEELLGWIARNMDEDHHPELDCRARAFFAGLSPAQMTLAAYADPGLAGRIVERMRA